MKTSRFIAGLSAAIIATSMTAAIPASAGQASTGGTTASAEVYDLIDVKNAFVDAGIDAQNVQSLWNFLIQNCEFFDSKDYADMIYLVNEIKQLYIQPLAERLFGSKGTAKLDQADRYHIYDNLQPAARDAIKKKIEKFASKKFVNTTWSTQTVKSKNGTESKEYALWYGTLDVTKAVRKADIQKNPNAQIIPTSGATKITKCTFTLAGTKLAYKAGVKRAPKLVVSYNGKALVKGKDYTLTYKNVDKMGKASIIVNGTGAFEGKKTIPFYVVPEQAAFANIPYKTGSTVYVKIAEDKNVTNPDINPCTGGYQIQFGSTSRFDSGTVRTFATKNYAVVYGKVLAFDQMSAVNYVRVRAFVNVKKADGLNERHYGAWSKVAKV
jgi:hypothetical protein